MPYSKANAVRWSDKATGEVKERRWKGDEWELMPIDMAAALLPDLTMFLQEARSAGEGVEIFAYRKPEREPSSNPFASFSEARQHVDENEARVQELRDAQALRDNVTIQSLRRQLEEAQTKVQYLTEHGVAGRMHEVDKAFYDLSIIQRDAAWRELERIKNPGSHEYRSGVVHLIVEPETPIDGATHLNHVGMIRRWNDEVEYTDGRRLGTSCASGMDLYAIGYSGNSTNGG